MNADLSPLKVLVLAALLLPSMPTIQAHEGCGEAHRLAIAFENMDEEAAAEANKIVAECAARFERITGKKVGDRNVRLRFEDSLRMPGQALAGGGEVRGATTHSADSSTVRISTRSRSRWQRVLAHEIVHVFIRDAFGQAPNKTLNEGLAEYVASQLYCGEVQRDLQSARRGKFNQALLPYIEGHRFCAEHAEDAAFAKFFAREIRSSDTSYETLTHLWNQANTGKARPS